MDMSAEGLLREAATGDAAAFGALVREHQSKVRGFLRRLTRGDAALADDLAQETFPRNIEVESNARGDLWPVAECLRLQLAYVRWRGVHGGF